MKFPFQRLPSLAQAAVLKRMDATDTISISLTSKRSARIVRAAVLRFLVNDITSDDDLNQSFIAVYNKRNDQYDLIMRLGMTEARYTKNEIDFRLYDKVIRLQNVRGRVDLKSTNLCLPRGVRNMVPHIQTVVDYLVFIFPRATFRNLVISANAFASYFDRFDYAKCLRSVTKTESLSIRRDIRGTAYEVQSLLSHLEVTKSLRIEKEVIPYLAGYRLSCSERIFLVDGRAGFVKIGHPWGVRNLHEEVGAVECDPSKRPPSDDGGMDIYKPNGLVGTSIQTKDWFSFKVWHEQFH